MQEEEEGRRLPNEALQQPPYIDIACSPESVIEILLTLLSEVEGCLWPCFRFPDTYAKAAVFLRVFNRIPDQNDQDSIGFPTRLDFRQMP